MSLLDLESGIIWLDLDHFDFSILHQGFRALLSSLRRLRLDLPMLCQISYNLGPLAPFLETRERHRLRHHLP